MKIGILTFHRVLNYGAQLQAYALQTFLEQLGYDSYIADYWPKYRQRSLKLFSIKYFLPMGLGQKLIYLKSHLAIFRYYRRNNNNNEFVEKYLKTSSDTSYDALICGSDQIWRKIYYPPFYEYDDTYFGCGQFRAPLVVSYAASMGNVHFKTTADEVRFSQLLKNVNQISVREQDLKDYIESHTGFKCQLVLDPVFLLSKEQWMQLIDMNEIPKQRYLLYYNHQGLKYTDNFVKSLSKKNDLKIIEIDPEVIITHCSKRYRQTDNARQFLSLIYGAEYVVSTSFHGFALAVRLEKQVYFASRKAKANRIINLARLLELEDRNIQNKVNYSKIEYSQVSKILDELSVDSRNWLINSIQNCSL